VLAWRSTGLALPARRVQFPGKPGGILALGLDGLGPIGYHHCCLNHSASLYKGFF
jgi:hypothetical protein